MSLVKSILMYGISIPNPNKLSDQQVEDIENLSDVYNLECDINRGYNDSIDNMTIGVYGENITSEGTSSFGATIEELQELKREFENCYTADFISQLSVLLEGTSDDFDLVMHLTNGAKVLAIAYQS